MLALPLVASLCFPCPQEVALDSAAAEVAETTAIARQLLLEYAELGVEIEDDEFTFEVLDPEECHEDFARLEVLGTGFFETAHFLFQGLGVAPVEATVEELREGGIEHQAASHSAYYQPHRKAFVFVRGSLRELVESLGGQEALIAHELYHAYQDQRDPGGILGGFGAGMTTDQRDVQRCLLEGEAELGALELMLHRSGQGLEDLDEGALDTMDQMEGLLGGAGITRTYAAGRRFLVEMASNGGREAVRAAFGEVRPMTSEQVLHPEKRSGDLPTPVYLGDFSSWEQASQLQLVHGDQVGELRMHALLTGLGSEKAAWLAAAGWDGDRLRFYRDADGGRVLIWRSVWDRPEDAEQFALLLEGQDSPFSSTVQQEGRLVDWICSEVELPSAPPLAVLELPEESDGALSTAAVEARFERENAEPEVDGRKLVMERLGVSIRIPTGWKSETQGAVFFLRPDAFAFDLMGDPEFKAGRSDIANINLQKLANPLGDDLKALKDLNAQQMQAMNLELVRMEIEDHEDRQVLRYRMQGEITGHDLVFWGMIVPEGNQQIVITATAPAGEAERLSPILEKAIDSVRFLDQ